MISCIIADDKLDLDNNCDLFKVIWSPLTAFDTDDGSVLQLSDYIEDKKEYFKSEIVSNISNLGSTIINGTSLYNYLTPNDSFSYWYLTNTLEKDLYLNDNSLIDIIKLLALEKLLGTIDKDVIIYGCPNYFKSSLENFFEYKNNFFSGNIYFKKYPVFKCFSKLLLSLVRLNLLFARSFLLKVYLKIFAKRKHFSTQPISIFYNYFHRINSESEFSSSYWSDLVDILKVNKIPNSWIHIYIKTREIKSIFNSATKIIKFNNSSQPLSNHYLLEEFFPIKYYFNAVRDLYCLSFRISRRLNFNFRDNDHITPIILPFLVSDLRNTFLSQSGVDRIFQNYLFKELSLVFNKFSKNIYLAESKPWERSLCFHLSNNTYAYSHATVRYWDIRYSFYFDSNESTMNKYYPLKLLVTGQHQINNMLLDDSYFKNKNIKYVEATRYLDLNQRQNNLLSTRQLKLNILIVGDASKGSSSRLIEILNNIQDKFYVNNFTFRAHPLAHFNQADFSFEIAFDQTSSISTSICNSNIVITTHLTSASYDCYCHSKPVLIMSHESGLNLSPLKKNEFDEFNNSTELSFLLDSFLLKPIADSSQKTLNMGRKLYIDKNLSKWISILS